MGCNCSRTKSAPERILQRTENGFLLQDIPASTAIMAFASHSSDGNSLTKSELKDALSLILENNTPGQRTQLVEQLYSGLGTHNYALRKLKCLAILLSKDVPLLKTFLLFDTYDTDGDKAITREDLENMIGDAWEISNKDIPTLTKMFMEEEDPDFKRYIDKISMITKERMTSYITKLMVGNHEKIEREKFSQILTSTHLSALFSPSSFRGYCYTFIP